MVVDRKRNGSAITSQNYFAGLGEFGAARSSLSEARSKLSWRAFEYLLGELNRAVPDILWRGHRVYAVDGCHLSLPASQEILKEYPRAQSEAKRTHYPKMMLVTATNVLSGVPYAARTAAGESGSERALLGSMLDEFKLGDIVLADRGFDGAESLHEIDKRGLYFIVRMKTGDTTAMPIRGFIASGKRSAIVEFFDPSGGRVQVRLIRNGRDHKKRVIVVATNLIGDAYPAKDIYRLYLKRWRIETMYYRVKELLQAQTFYARSLNGVMQELWANFFVLGLTAHVVGQSRLVSKSLKVPNFKNAVEVVRRHLHSAVSLKVTNGEANRIAELMIDQVRAVVVRQQPGRKNPRLSKQTINRWTIGRPLGKDRPKNRLKRASVS